uniref:G-protein coupled receptors family 2 profile 2 domain-containing protein n=1 Tax=Panagrolaimus sp. PS1159 TaxID=55785 RepID=A0AC35FNJ6_9BILA
MFIKSNSVANTFNEGQQQPGFCPGLIISFNITGSQCSSTGNFNIILKNQTLFLSESNITLTNIDSNTLCAQLDSLNPGGKSECVTYNVSESGNFTIKIAPCNSPLTILQQFGPIYYNSSGLSTNFGKCDNTSKPCSPTVSSFLKFLPNSDNSLPVNRLSIDDYCTPTPSPPPPEAINPPQPTFNCSDPNNSYIIKQTCKIANTSDQTVITQTINDTSTQIQDEIKKGSLNSTSVHDAGAFIYSTVKTLKFLNTEGAHSILDIISSIAVQPLQTLQGANTITNNSLLWYPSALPIVVAKTNANLAYKKDGSNVLLNSFILDSSFCGNSTKSHEICYSKNSQVSSGSDDAEFCTTFNPTSLCNNSSKKAYLTMWKSLSFFVLVKNNSLGIKTGISEKPEKQEKSNGNFLWSFFSAAQENTPQSSAPNQPVTFDTAEVCSSGVYFKNSYASNAGGVDENGVPSTTVSTVWVKRRSDENDLHVSNFQIASFMGDSFVNGGAEVKKDDKHYTADCYQGTCTLLVDGNPTEPLVCSSGAKTTQAVIGGIGIFITVIGIFGFFFKSKTIPVISTIAAVLFNIFNDKNLPKRLKFFAYCYNATFLLYSLYLLLFAEQQITNTSKGMCTFFAVVGYILYISAVFLSVIMIIITLDALGCWKPAIQKVFFVFTGNQKIYVPFIYSYGIPLLLTAIFAAALTSFFKRNDGYCWIRPDYAFLALWLPLIILLLTIPLYVILIARRWPNSPISKKIYSPLTVSDDLTNYEESKKKRKVREKKEDKKDDDSIEKGTKLDDVVNNDEEDDGKIVLTNRTLARLIIPQLFLAIPLIAENLALYYAKLTGWHYLFFLTQAFHLIALHGINFIDKIPKVRAVWNWVKGKFTKKSKAKNDETEVEAVEKPKKPPRGKRRENVLPNEIEDFEAVTLARDSELQNPRPEQMRMTRRPIESSEDGSVDGIEVISHENELSEAEEGSPRLVRSYRNASSISIGSLPATKEKQKDDAILTKDEARHAGAANDGGETSSTKSLQSYTPEAASETEIPIKVHILRLDSTMLIDSPFVREPVDEWLQDTDLPPYIPLEETLEKPGDWRHHLNKQGVHLQFSDIPTRQSEVEEKIVEDVLHPNLPSQTYSDDTTQIIDNLPDIEQISRYYPNYRGMYEFDQHSLQELSPDEHLPLDYPFIREPVEVSKWNDMAPSYIPYVGELAKSEDSSDEEELVEQVLHANLPPQIYLDSATLVIDSLQPVEEIARYEPDYVEMYHFDKNPVHSLSPDEHLPLDIPFIRESIETAVAQGITPSYIPLDPRRPSIVSVHQDEMVEEVLEAIIPTAGLPPDKWILPESQGSLPTFEINMDDLYKFDRYGLHYLSRTKDELPVDCPFIRDPVEEDFARNRAPSYIPYDRDLALSDQRVEDQLIKEVLDVKVLSLSEILHEDERIGRGAVVAAEEEKEWIQGEPKSLRHSASGRHDEGIHHHEHVHHHHHLHEHEHAKHEPIGMGTTKVTEHSNVHKEHELSGYPEILKRLHHHDETYEILVYEKQLEKSELSQYILNLSPPNYYSTQYSIATSEASTSIYQTPPETPIHAPSTLLHFQTPPDNISLATQFYQTPPETPFQNQMSHHPLSSHIHHHHRHGSSGSESEFPFFKFKTLRNEDLVGPENVIHSDSTSLAEDE